MSSSRLQTMFLQSQAAGGIVSTARDLEKFMAALASGKLGRSLWRSFRAHVYFMNLFNFRYQNSTSQKSRKDKSKSQRFNVSLKRTSWQLVGTVFRVQIRGDLELGDVGSLQQGISCSKDSFSRFKAVPFRKSSRQCAIDMAQEALPQRRRHAEKDDPRHGWWGRVGLDWSSAFEVVPRWIHSSFHATSTEICPI